MNDKQKPSFPGAVGLTELAVYGWPAEDGFHGGSPHVHLVCAECYVVVEGVGELHTITPDGFQVADLKQGDVVWFQPGTIHRAVNISGSLKVMVVMGNGGLPEAGDAVMTFPPEHLTSLSAYLSAAAVTNASGEPDLELGRARRDRAVKGYLRIKDAVIGGNFTPLHDFYRAAVAIAAERSSEWGSVVRDGLEVELRLTERRLAGVRASDPAHLLEASVARIPRPQDTAVGMCGVLTAYDPPRLAVDAATTEADAQRAGPTAIQ